MKPLELRLDAVSGRRVAHHAADLGTHEGCADVHAAAIRQMSDADILIDAAGGTFPEQPDEEMIGGFALRFHGAGVPVDGGGARGHC